MHTVSESDKQIIYRKSSIELPSQISPPPFQWEKVIRPPSPPSYYSSLIDLLYLSFSTLYHSSLWRTDIIIFAKLTTSFIVSDNKELFIKVHSSYYISSMYNYQLPKQKQG